MKLGSCILALVLLGSVYAQDREPPEDVSLKEVVLHYKSFLNREVRLANVYLRPARVNWSNERSWRTVKVVDSGVNPSYSLCGDVFNYAEAPIQQLKDDNWNVVKRLAFGTNEDIQLQVTMIARVDDWTEFRKRPDIYPTKPHRGIGVPSGILIDLDTCWPHLVPPPQSPSIFWLDIVRVESVESLPIVILPEIVEIPAVIPKRADEAE